MTEKLTLEGKEKLEKEREELIHVKKLDAQNKLAEARALGDLSENAEYEAAKGELELINSEIERINAILSDYEIIDMEKIDVSTVQVGCTVTVYDITNDEILQYQIVGGQEANISDNKINMDSPLVKHILGHKEGDVVKFDAPMGSVKVRIEKITI